jgi:hypothetical protein
MISTWICIHLGIVNCTFVDRKRDFCDLRAWGDHSLLCFAYTCVQDLFIGGVIYLAKKIIR